MPTLLKLGEWKCKALIAPGKGRDALMTSAPLKSLCFGHHRPISLPCVSASNISPQTRCKSGHTDPLLETAESEWPYSKVTASSLLTTAYAINQ